MGQSGPVFVLDMGEPVRIVELARDMIRLAGRAPSEIGIEFIGLRPWRKSSMRELLVDAEPVVSTGIERLQVATLHTEALEGLFDWLAALSNSGVNLSDEQVRK